jgi:hypothetical protein
MLRRTQAPRKALSARRGFILFFLLPLSLPACRRLLHTSPTKLPARTPCTKSAPPTAPSFPLCRVRPFSWGRSRPSRDFHFSPVPPLVIDVLSAPLPRDNLDNLANLAHPCPIPNHCHELAIYLHGCNRLLSTFLSSSRSFPTPVPPLPCFSRPATKNHSQRSPWTLLTHVAELPRPKMMAWIRSASTPRGPASQLPSQISMTDGCRGS